MSVCQKRQNPGDVVTDINYYMWLNLWIALAFSLFLNVAVLTTEYKENVAHVKWKPKAFIIPSSTDNHQYFCEFYCFFLCVHREIYDYNVFENNVFNP